MELTLERVCFLLRVREDKLEDYRRAHENVWPEMLAALREAGWANYSIFLAADGLVVGYLECRDFAAAQAAMAATEVNDRWQTAMAGYFTGLGGKHADERMVPLPEVFHLD